MQRTPSLRQLERLCMVALIAGAYVSAHAPGSARAESLRLAVAQRDLDLSVETEAPATQVRWLFLPNPGFQRSLLTSDGGAREVAQLSTFSDLRILEAPIDSLQRVEELWSEFGDLRRDERGRPNLEASAELVGAGPELWDTLDLRGDPASTVAILDSGVDTAHDDLGDVDDDNQDLPPLAGDDGDWAPATPSGFSQDLQFRVVGWHDVTDDLPDALGPYDYHYHGTAVAGAAFGGGRINILRRGIAPEGRFVVVKTWNFENRWERWASDFLLGVDWVLSHRDLYRIRAVLITTDWSEDLGWSDAVDALLNAGIAIIAAAGNTGDTEMGYPALVPGVITVGATNSMGLVASYSTIAPPGSGALDLMAPGGSLLDPADLLVVPDNEPNDTYRGRVGTSLAAAHVAGAVSILSQAYREKGERWTQDRARVQWLTSILRATAAETPGAETGSLGTPRTNRFGADDVEGWGLLQIRAALGAVRDVLWAGENRRMDLQEVSDGPATWAARIPVEGEGALSVDLVPPPAGDFDLFVYREFDDGLHLAGRSDRAGLGRAESVHIDHPGPGWYVVVVKRVSGSGEGQIFTGREDALSPVWPLKLLSNQVSSPTRYDLDGDGVDELIATNELLSSPTDHRIYVVQSNGQPLPGFPRFLAGATDRSGHLGTPAIGLLGNRVAIVAGGETGELFAVDADASFRFRVEVSGHNPTTAPVILDPGPAAHVAVGTRRGVVLVDTAGALEDTLAMAAGVSRDMAADDLDGDGNDELVVVDDANQVHVLELDGSEWPGWPQLVPNAMELTPPILLGDSDGQPASRVAFAAIDLAGQASLDLRGLDGVSLAGFPVELNPIGSMAVAISPVIGSGVEFGGPIHLVMSLLVQSAGGELTHEFFAVNQSGAVEWSSSRTIAQREFSASYFSVHDAQLSEPIALQWTSGGRTEFVQGVRAYWTEFVSSGSPRYGSLRTWWVWGEDPMSGSERWSLDEGHREVPDLPALSALSADLDADGRGELYLPRAAGISRFVTRLEVDFNAPDPRRWTLARGDPARRACAGCTADVVVAAPEATPVAEIRLDVIPNPFNPRARLRVEGMRAGELRWELFDARGRRVRRWSSWTGGEGTHEEIFEPTDQRGRRLASGSYLLRVSDGQRSLRRRLTLLQ